MNRIIVSLRNQHGEVWHGPLRDFYRLNEVTRDKAREVHAQFRRHGNAVVASGAHRVFALEIVRLS